MYIRDKQDVLLLILSIIIISISAFVIVSEIPPPTTDDPVGELGITADFEENKNSTVTVNIRSFNSDDVSHARVYISEEDDVTDRKAHKNALYEGESVTIKDISSGDMIWVYSVHVDDQEVLLYQYTVE